MTEEENRLEIRCFCRHQPLLAVAGRDAKTGEPFVHVRSWKSKQIHTDVVVTSGTVHIHCRECLRWQTVTIKRTKVDLKAENLPESIQV